MNTVQRRRLLWCSAFFAPFPPAPVLDLLTALLTRNRFAFISVAGTLFVIDFGSRPTVPYDCLHRHARSEGGG